MRRLDPANGGAPVSERDDLAEQSYHAPAPMEAFIVTEAGRRVRIAPCSNPYHRLRFTEGYAVVTCNKCVMEDAPLADPAGPGEADL